ncbi:MULTISPECIES: hypothetical protein [unclassified Nostoc]|nr:hypothetical protein [Nostoc sp. DedQUE03]MDZ7970900.1 hypothetical protein [Nostoc sp. DedQUE03]MDZ8045927.1 hypothetical protein [Nostoc sp. DedQUE02]
MISVLDNSHINILPRASISHIPIFSIIRFELKLSASHPGVTFTIPG